MAILENGGATEHVIFCIMGCMSILGCLLYLYCYFFLHPVRSFARKLLAFIALTEGLSIFGNVAGIIYMTTFSPYQNVDYGTDKYPDSCDPKPIQPPSGQFCQIQAFLTNFFSISSFIYNSGLAIMMVLITMTNKVNKWVYWTINATAWIVPAVVCKFWEILTEVILIASYISLKGVLVYKQRQLRKKGASQEVIQTLQAVESLYKRLLLIPISFFFCYIFGTIQSYVLLADPNNEVPDWILNFLAFVHGFGNNAPGFINCVIFIFLQKNMREELKKDVKSKYKTISLLIRGDNGGGSGASYDASSKRATGGFSGSLQNNDGRRGSSTMKMRDGQYLHRASFFAEDTEDDEDFTANQLFGGISPARDYITSDDDTDDVTDHSVYQSVDHSYQR
ncbi:uncharacterized protein LOC142338664 isoform X2 [Convolutriloba macropyga]|uniref:uncharacterized protein LOC142338664 isoform X2 n=1 Tax=Convolutriloba macropyga TaxID=536237 RepID=UPI003F51C65B